MTDIVDYNKALKQDYFLNETSFVAKSLIGKLLIRKVNEQFLCSEIVETEAYLPFGDKANHSAKGKTPRNAAMHEVGGIIYVYQIYGIHHCVNVVTETEGLGAAVLLRASKPIIGINQFQINRNIDNLEKLCKGPGNLAKAYNFTKADNFTTLLTTDLFIQNFNSYDDEFIMETYRIGINESKDLKLRYYLKNCEFVTNIIKNT